MSDEINEIQNEDGSVTTEFISHSKKPFFVYGTLKKDRKNHHILENLKASYLRDCETKDKYPMFDLGNGFPFLQNKKGVGHKIKGELWYVQDRFEKDLDYFEGVPDLYKKGTVKVDIDYLETVNCYFIADELDTGELEQVNFFNEWKEESFDFEEYYKKFKS